MSVQIIINGENATEAIKELSTLAQSMGGSAPIAAVVEKVAPKSKVKPASETTAKDVTPAEKVETEEVEPDQAEEVEVITDVDLRAKAQEVGADPANKPKIKALLNEYGVSNLTAVPNAQRAEFIKRLNAI